MRPVGTELTYARDRNVTDNDLPGVTVWIFLGEAQAGGIRDWDRVTRR